MRVDIVLASYNGEKFISEFIESLFQQTYQNWKLIVSDDGSQDKTVEVIDHYISLDGRIVLVNQIPQKGVINNFNRALSFVESDYIMFADQDDVWLPSKLEESINYFKVVESTEGKHIPLLLFSDLILVDESLNLIAASFYKYRNLNPLNNTSFKYLLWCSSLYGCTVLFNRALLKIVKNIDDRVMMHDQIFGLFASLFGKVVFLDEPTVLYRQHDANVIGGLNRTLRFKIFNIYTYYARFSIYSSKLKSHILFVQEYLSKKNLDLDDFVYLKWFLSRSLLDRLKFWNFCVRPFIMDRLLFSLSCTLFIIFNRN